MQRFPLCSVEVGSSSQSAIPSILTSLLGPNQKPMEVSWSLSVYFNGLWKRPLRPTLWVTVNHAISYLELWVFRKLGDSHNFQTAVYFNQALCFLGKEDPKGVWTSFSATFSSFFLVLLCITVHAADSSPEPPHSKDSLYVKRACLLLHGLLHHHHLIHLLYFIDWLKCWVLIEFSQSIYLPLLRRITQIYEGLVLLGALLPMISERIPNSPILLLTSLINTSYITCAIVRCKEMRSLDDELALGPCAKNYNQSYVEFT